MRGEAGPRARRLAGLVIAALAFAALSPLLGAEFVNFDDPVYVTENARVLVGVTWANVRWAFSTIYFGFYYPLTWLSHMLDCQLFGLWAGGHHLTSLLIHVLSALLLLALLERSTGDLWPSALVAGLFAVHPLHVESVAWIAERKDVLSTLFLMLALLAYARYAERPGIPRYLPVFLFLLLGLLSKSMVVTAPVLMLLMDYWPLRRLELDAAGTRWRTAGRLLAEKAPLFTLSAIFSILTLHAQAGVAAVGSFQSFPLHIRVMNALIAVGLYIAKTAVPTNLAIFYPYFRDEVTLVRALPAALLLALVTALCGRMRKRYPFLLMGWLWFLVCLAPVSGILQAGSQSAADRYTYVASVGLFVMVAWGAASVLLQAKWGRVAAIAAGSVLLVIFSVLSWRQAATWHDSVTLFGHAARVTSRNYLAHTLLGMALDERGDSEGAVEQLKKAVRFAPDYVDAWGDLGNVFRERGELDKAAACYQRVMALAPSDARACNNMGLVCERQGRIPEAEAWFGRAVALDGSNAQYSSNLGRALAHQGRYAEARALFERAVRLQPQSARGWFFLGAADAKAGNAGDARRELLRALDLEPGMADARRLLAEIGAASGETPR